MVAHKTLRNGVDLQLVSLCSLDFCPRDSYRMEDSKLSNTSGTYRRYQRGPKQYMESS